MPVAAGAFRIATTAVDDGLTALAKTRRARAGAVGRAVVGVVERGDREDASRRVGDDDGERPEPEEASAPARLAQNTPESSSDPVPGPMPARTAGLLDTLAGAAIMVIAAATATPSVMVLTHAIDVARPAVS